LWFSHAINGLRNFVCFDPHNSEHSSSEALVAPLYKRSNPLAMRSISAAVTFILLEESVRHPDEAAMLSEPDSTAFEAAFKASC
jgi:hypothetical protein